MIDDHIETNPFELTKANDFTDAQILEYWVDLAGESGLLSFLNPASKVPMFLLGSKGSGKTHLLRYCSAPVQRLRRPGPFLDAVERDGYVGIYVLADGLNASRFKAKGQPPDVWQTIFQYYFENWLAQLVLRTANEFVPDHSAASFRETELVDAIVALFDSRPALSEQTLSAILAFLGEEQRKMDFDINNSALSRRLEVRVLYSPGKLIFGIPDAICRLVTSMRGVTFSYLIDELENFSEAQQQFVNSLIRYRSGPSTFKIGARLYGIKTTNTADNGEPIRDGAEFGTLHLDSMMRKHRAGYLSFARILCVKRLHEADIVHFPGAEQQAARSLGRYFEEQDPRDYYRADTAKLVAKYDGRERPYFERLRKQLHEASLAVGDALLDLAAIEDIVNVLRCPNYPLLEKLNIFLLYKEWANGNLPLGAAARRISAECRASIENPRSGSQYTQVLSHFQGDLLAQLYRDCSYRPIYAGFDALIQMSQGVPRNFLGLLKQIYKRSLFYGEQPFIRGHISIQTQQDGVRDAADWFLEDAQPDSYGSEVRTSVDLLAQLFRAVRFSDKPAECSLVTFSVDESTMTTNARQVLRNAENWSFLIKIRHGEKYRNSRGLFGKYQLNPILAPRWDLSESRRGTIPLQPPLANAIFDPELRKQFRPLLNDRVAGMVAPWFGATRQRLADGRQFGLDIDGP